MSAAIGFSRRCGAVGFEARRAPGTEAARRGTGSTGAMTVTGARRGIRTRHRKRSTPGEIGLHRAGAGHRTFPGAVPARDGQSQLKATGPARLAGRPISIADEDQA